MSVAYTVQATATETILAEVLAEIVGVEQVSVDSDFFDDLGADSMVMAHFCARARKRPGLPSVSMKDIYRHPTIRSLARALDAEPQSPVPALVPAPTEVATPVGSAQYVLCGALQFLSVFGYLCLIEFVFARGYDWISAGSGLIDDYLRSVLFGGAGFLGLCTFPILAKWMLIGRWKRQRIRIWSLAYVRFWVVKTLIRIEPAGPVRRVADLRALPARARREDRPGSGDLLHARARMHRSALDRRRHGHSQGRVLQLLPSPRRRDRDRPGQPREGRARRRGDGARHRDLARRRSAARPRLLAARRASHPGRRAPARFSGAAAD